MAARAIQELGLNGYGVIRLRSTHGCLTLRNENLRILRVFYSEERHERNGRGWDAGMVDYRSFRKGGAASVQRPRRDAKSGLCICYPRQPQRRGLQILTPYIHDMAAGEHTAYSGQPQTKG